MHEHAEAPVERSARLRLPALVAFVVVSVVRWWFSSDRHVFHISPDEPSQLAIARFLAGENRWNMFDHATWQPLLGTLISPIYWFTTDGETAVRWALGVNAVIGGLGAATLVLLTRRLTGLPEWGCAAVATLVALAPSSLSASSFVWAEPLVALAFTATVLTLVRSYETDRLGVAAGAITISIAGYLAHSRLLPLVATTLLLTVGVDLWRRRWQRAGLLWIVAMAGIAAAALWKRWLLDRIWDDPSDQNTVGAVLNRLTDPLAVLDSLAGQVWYQLVATAGLAAFGTVVVVGRSWPRRRTTTSDTAGDNAIDTDTALASDDEPGADESAIEPAPGTETETERRPSPVDARILLVSWLPIVGLSAVFMSDRGRPDQYIYGRYNDAVMWPVLVIGIAWLVARVRDGFRRRHVVAATLTVGVTIALGVIVDRIHGDELRESYGVRAMIPGVLAHVNGSDTFDVWRATWITAVLVAGVVGTIAVARRAGRAGSPVLAIGTAVAIAVVAIAVVRTRDIADAKLNGWQRAAAVREIDELVPPGVALGVRPVPSSREPEIAWVPQRQRYMLYQLYLPDRSFVRDRGVDDGVGPYVFAPVEDPDMLAADAQLLWSDPTIRIGLWKEPPPTP